MKYDAGRDANGVESTQSYRDGNRLISAHIGTIRERVKDGKRIEINMALLDDAYLKNSEVLDKVVSGLIEDLRSID